MQWMNALYVSRQAIYHARRQGALLLRSTSIPAWLGNCIIIWYYMKLIIHSQTYVVWPLKFGNGWIMSPYLLLTYDYLNMLGLKSIHTVKCAPGNVITLSITINPWWRHQMETFSASWPIVLGIRRWPVNSPHKGQWRGALMFSLTCAWINGEVNNREAGDLRRHRAHHNVTAMRRTEYMIDNKHYGQSSAWWYGFLIWA